MQRLAEPRLNLAKFSNPSKVLQALKKIQFIMEFFVLSRYSQNSDVIAEFLLAIEAFKFYYKVAHFATQDNTYQENPEQRARLKQQNPANQLQKMSQLLQKIKTKPYESANYQPQQFEQLACGKKIQLVTSVQVPSGLKRQKLGFLALLGQVLYLLRPFISIVGIRLFGLNNYRSYFLSLVIDLLILLVFQRKLTVSNKGELEQLQGRKRQFITRYIFRRPLFLVLKNFLIEPVLKKVIKQNGMIYKLILSILEMQSSITLTV